MAFDSEQAEKLTGVSKRRQRYWNETGVLKPSLLDEPRMQYGRIYSFRDLVSLRTLQLLRDEHGLPLQKLRVIGNWLKQHYVDPWSTLTFYIAGSQVIFVDPESSLLVTTSPPGQGMLVNIDPQRVEKEIESAARKLRRRRTSDIGRIERRRGILQSKPVVKGTRIPTSIIWDFHQAGYTTEQILDEYPSLDSEDVAAAISIEQELRRVAS